MVARAPGAASLTPADEVRSVLSDCEQALGSLPGSGGRALAILHGLDRLHDLLPELETRGMDLRSERTRLANLEAELLRLAAALVRELRAVGGLSTARQAVPVDRTRWWWYLDEHAGQQRWSQARRVLLGAGVAAAVLLVLALVYQRFMAPDPVVVRSLELRSQGETLAQAGDYNAALAKLEEAQALVPSDGELFVWRGVLAALAGEPTRASELFDAAVPLFDGQSAFLIARAQTYLQLQDADGALADAAAVLKGDPESPEGLLVQAGALEAKGLDGQAVDSFEAASRYAEQRGMDELSAVARFRMGLLLQRAGIPQLPE